MPKIKQTAHRASFSVPEIEEEDDFVKEGAEIAQEEASGSRTRKKRRTRAEMAEEKRREWEGSFGGKKFKNERQVDANKFSLDHFGVHCILQKGLKFWTEVLPGYNKNTVIDFYKYMQIPEGDWENDPAVRIVSRVTGIDVVITPNDIAVYLGIQRPPPESVNYPQKNVTIDSGVVNNVLYVDPSKASDPHMPGNFKGSVRFLNKVIHFNLYPRGSDHRPSRKSGELMFAFLTDELVIDWAMFIFTQLRDFRANTMITASIPFPCMITSLCWKQGVKGWGYENLEELSPGVFDEAFDTKSSSQAHSAKGKQAKGGDYLTSMSKKKDKQTSWIKKLFCQGVAHIVSRRKEKAERRQIMREQERQKKEIAWQTSILEQQHGVKYVPEPEVEEGEISDDYAGYESEEQDD